MVALFNRLKFHFLAFSVGLLTYLILAKMSNLYGEAGFLIFMFGVMVAFVPTMIEKFRRNSRRSINEIIEMSTNTKKHEHDPEELMLAVSCTLGIASAMGIIHLVMR